MTNEKAKPLTREETQGVTELRDHHLSLLAKRAAATDEAAQPAALVKGSAEYLAEREERLAAQVARAKAALDKVTAAKAADASGADARLAAVNERLSEHDATTQQQRSCVERISADIAHQREKIADIERGIEQLLADKSRVEETLLVVENDSKAEEPEMLAAALARDVIEKKWSKRLREAEKEHQQLSLRLTRLQLRRAAAQKAAESPKTEEERPTQPTKLPNGLHTMPGPLNEGNA